MKRKIVSGIEFEAVRFSDPRPHWRAKVVQTGYVFEAGVFHSKSRPEMWEDMEHIARLRGDLWEPECLMAHLPAEAWRGFIQQKREQQKANQPNN